MTNKEIKEVYKNLNQWEYIYPQELLLEVEQAIASNEVAVAYFTNSTNATFELFDGSTIMLEPTGEVNMWD